MPVSKEVKAAVDQIRKDKDVISSMRKADDVRDQQLADLKAQLADHPSLSDEDKKALTDAVGDIQGTNDELGGAVTANTSPDDAGSAPNVSGQVAPVGHDDHPTEPPTSGDVLSVNGPANHPAGGSAPLMPTSAFDPSPGMASGASDGQPAQAKAIETAGGFVVSGGGTTQRAPGSSPESPSSSLVVPLDPDAKGPASTADVAKSGLGDSSQNATLGNDGQPIADGPGMVQEPSQADQDAAQKQLGLAQKEKDARADNPLNLAPAGTPQAGSPDADKAAAEQKVSAPPASPTPNPAA